MLTLGGNCAISFRLKEKRGPFDWCKINLSKLIDVLENNFIDYNKLIIKKESIDHHLYIHDKSDSAFEITNDSTLILTNKYGIQFAHEIKRKYQLNKFAERLKVRIKRFINYVNPKFIRLETQNLSEVQMGKYKKLIDVLDKYFINYQIVLISKNNIPFKCNKIKWIKLKSFSSDWKFPDINWEEILI